MEDGLPGSDEIDKRPSVRCDDRVCLAFRFCLWATDQNTYVPVERKLIVRDPLNFVRCDESFDAFAHLSFFWQPWARPGELICELVRVEPKSEVVVQLYRIPLDETASGFVHVPFSATLPALEEGLYDLRLWDRSGLLRSPEETAPVCLSHYLFRSVSADELATLAVSYPKTRPTLPTSGNH